MEGYSEGFAGKCSDSELRDKASIGAYFYILEINLQFLRQCNFTKSMFIFKCFFYFIKIIFYL